MILSFYFKKKFRLSFPFFLFFLLIGIFGCGDSGSETGSSAPVEDSNEVDLNQVRSRDQGSEDPLFTGEGIIDPIELSSGREGTGTPNTTQIDFSTAFKSPKTPLVLKSLIVASNDICNGNSFNLFSSEESYNAVEAAKRVTAHIEKHAIYTSFRAERSGSVITVDAPRNSFKKYKRRILKWRFLMGKSQVAKTVKTVMDGYSSGESSFLLSCCHYIARRFASRCRRS